MRFRKAHAPFRLAALALLIIGLTSSSALAQGSIFGSVQNADLTVPANGTISFYGYLDNTDEEIRLESSAGAGYDNGNWFDDFQNYLTEAPGNPYDYHFFNSVNGEGFQLSGSIPNNSFQQEDIVLGAISWPAAPTGLSTTVISGTRVLIEWTPVAGETYHVYRRLGTSTGSFFRIDDPTGSLANPGVAGDYFVDATTDGASTYEYLVIAEDGSGNLSPHSAIVSANSAAAIAPTIATVDPANGPTAGGTTVTITGSGFDAGGATVTFGAAAPVAATVVSPFELTAVTPAGTAGSVDVLVTNTASGLNSNTLTGAFTYDANTAPTFAAQADTTIDEGQTLLLTVSASDPDGTTPTLTAANLPANASFLDNTDGTGTMTFTPDFTQSGSYAVTFIASDGALADTLIVTTTVANVNQTPTFAAQADTSIAEGQTLSLIVSATDPDGTIPALSAANLPAANASFVDNLDGTGTLTFSPDFTQAAVYPIDFIATDGSLSDTITVTVTVTETNLAPAFAAQNDTSVAEGGSLVLTVSASDPDGTTPSLSATNLPPTNASFADNLDGTGTLTFNPDFTQAGVYPISFIATDGALADTLVVSVTVTGTNLAPTFAATNDTTIDEGQLLDLVVSATDPDGVIPTLTAEGLPVNAGFTDNLDGTGTLSFTPDFTQSGSYPVTFIATDGLLSDTLIVTVTVSNVNLAPTFAAQSDTSIVEGQSLSLVVSASDPDGEIPGLSAFGLPANAGFVDNLDGTGTLSFTPDFSQSGSYPISFVASDGALDDTLIVTVTVLETNLPPSFAAQSDTTIAEGQSLDLTVSATDPDGATPVLTAPGLPANASFVDNLDGTGTLSFIPDYTQASSYPITFIASDGALSDTLIVTVTVTETNLAPVFAAQSDTTIVEGQTLSLIVSASDPDGTTPTLSAQNLPATNAGFVDNLDGTGTFTFTPDFSQSGTYPVSFIATDGSLSDTLAVTVTVAETNLPPVFAAQNDTTIAENQTLLLTVSATDPDGTTPTLSAINLPPANASFLDNGDGTGTLTFNPDFTQAGAYPIDFVASDGLATDTLTVTVTVTDAGNQPPVISQPADTLIVESQELVVAVTATDPDGETPTLSAYELGGTVLPANATFVDSTNGVGVLTFTPDLTQSGVYQIVFKALDPSLAVDSTVMQITVNETNQPPVLAAIADTSVFEGDTLQLTVTATDGDGTTPVLSAEGLPVNATFTDQLTGTGAFEFLPDFTQAGSYPITFIASDGVAADTLIVTVTVDEAGNQAPVLAALADSIALPEGDSVSFVVSATDPDGTTPTLSAINLPANATFVSDTNGTGNFQFAPDYTQGGVYSVTFIASDGLAADSQTVTITVTDQGNLPPVFAAIPDTSVNEGQTLVLAISATDPDGGGTPPDLDVATTIPLTKYTFVDNGDGTGTFTYNPNYLDAGTKSVTFYATDFGSPQLTGTKIVSITVNDVNQPPTLITGGPYGVAVGDTLVATVTATDTTDADTSNTLALIGLNLPSNATFVDNGDNSGTLTYIPTQAEAGTHYFAVRAIDQGTPSLSTTDSVEVVVVTENARPVIDPIGPQTVTEGNTLQVLMSASDPDGGIPVLFTGDLPDNASFVDQGNGTGLFTFSPDYTQAGDGPSALYDVTFKASDGIAVSKEVVLIQVYEAGDQNPTFEPSPSPTIVEATESSFFVVASDPDGGPVTISVLSGLPSGASFQDLGNDTGVVTWTPTYQDSGTYVIEFQAVDQNGLADTLSVSLVVQDAGNQTPVLAPVPDQSTTELRNLTFNVSASDVDGDTPVLSAAPLPESATFTDNGNGTGVFSWTPSDTASLSVGGTGIYQVSFFAIDSVDAALYDSLQVTISVADTNRVPRVIGVWPSAATISEGDVYTVTFRGADPDGPLPYFDAHLSGEDTLATNMTLVDNRDSSATFTFSPDYTQGGTTAGASRQYYVDFLMIDSLDPSLVYAKLSVQYTVQNKNQPPTLTFVPSGPYSLTEGDTLVVQVIAQDPDGGGAAAQITVGTLPPNATWSSIASSSGYLRFYPDFTQAGTYSVTFTAIDVGFATTQQSINIDVLEAGNQAPSFTTTLADTINIPVDNLAQITVQTTDPDGDAVTMTATPVDPDLTGATFGQNGYTGVWSYQPALAEDGNLYDLTFAVEDPSGLVDTLRTTVRVVSFLRGDLDGNKRYTMNDLSILISYLFRDGQPPQILESADVNADSGINVSDVSYFVRFMYYNGPQPPK